MKIRVVMGIMLALFLVSMFMVALVFADISIAIKGDPATGTVFPDPDPATGVVGNTVTWFLSASIRLVFPNAYKISIFVWADPTHDLTPWGEEKVSGFISPDGYPDGWEIVTGPTNTPGTFKYTITITDINGDVIFTVDPYLKITSTVGGFLVPVDKFGLLAPHIGVASAILVATVATAVYVKRVKRRETKNT